MRSIPALRRSVLGLCLAGALGFTAGCEDSTSGPDLDADLEARGALEFTCGVGCEFEGEFFNSGLGCARNVRGVTRLLRGDGAEIARSNWSLPVDERIGIRESERYEGCCFTPPDVALMGSYSTEISWDETDCI